MVRFNSHHSEKKFVLRWLVNLCGFIPFKLSSLTNVIKYRSIWEIDDHKTKIRRLFMLWTVPRWRKSVVLHYVVFRWLWSTLAIWLDSFFKEGWTNDSEIALDSNSTSTEAFRGRDTFHINLWTLAKCSKVHIFQRAVTCFFFC